MSEINAVKEAVIVRISIPQQVVTHAFSISLKKFKFFYIK